MIKMKKEMQLTIMLILIMGTYSIIDKLYGSAYILLLNGNHISPLDISLIFSISSLSLAFFDYPSGNIADFYGRKKSIAYGFIIWGIGLFIYANSSTKAFFIISVLINSFGISLYTGSPAAWYISELVKLNNKDYKNKVLPIVNSVISLLGVLAALMGGVLISRSIKMPLYVAAFVAWILGIAVLLLGNENYGEQYSKSFIKDIVISSKEFLKNSDMIKLLLYRIVKNISFTIFILSWQLYALNDLHINTQTIASLLALFIFARALTGFASSFLVNKGIKNQMLSLYGLTIQAVSFAFIFL